MTMKRLTVELIDLQKGIPAYLTKGIITYNVKFVSMEQDKAIVEVIEIITIHRKEMKRLGIKKVMKLSQGTKLKVEPKKLWSIDNPTPWEILKRWFKSKWRRQ
jgi:hypothetical protein